MLYTGGCDTCYMQEVVIHVMHCDTWEVVIHDKCRRL